MRPAYVIDRGCKVFISAHDEYFLQTRRSWRKKLVESHPDYWRRLVRHDFSSVKLPYAYDRCKCGGIKKKDAIRCIACAGPGRSRNNWLFHKTQQDYQKWLQQEKKWYEQYQLAPPGSSRQDESTHLSPQGTSLPSRVG